MYTFEYLFFVWEIDQPHTGNSLQKTSTNYNMRMLSFYFKLKEMSSAFKPKHFPNATSIRLNIGVNYSVRHNLGLFKN